MVSRPAFSDLEEFASVQSVVLDDGQAYFRTGPYGMTYQAFLAPGDPRLSDPPSARLHAPPATAACCCLFGFPLAIFAHSFHNGAHCLTDLWADTP